MADSAPRDDYMRPVNVSPEERERFREDGFAKIAGLLTPAGIEALTATADRELKRAPTKQGAGFNRFTYDLALQGDLLPDGDPVSLSRFAVPAT